MARTADIHAKLHEIPYIPPINHCSRICRILPDSGDKVFRPLEDPSPK